MAVVYHIAATYREAGQPDCGIPRDQCRGHASRARRGRRAPERTRVVHCSTGGVHGHIAHPPANEDAPFNPVTSIRRRSSKPSSWRGSTGAPMRSRSSSRGRSASTARRHALPEDVSGHGARAVSDARSGRGVLSPDVHRRSGRRIPAVRRRRRPRRGGHIFWRARATRR